MYSCRNDRSSIIFNIVDEPPALQSSDEHAECVDLGFANVNLFELLDAKTEGNVVLDVWTLNKSLKLGELRLTLSGISALKRVLESKS